MGQRLHVYFTLVSICTVAHPLLLYSFLSLIAVLIDDDIEHGKDVCGILEAKVEEEIRGRMEKKAVNM